MPKNRTGISNIYKRINKNNTVVGYGYFLSWVNDALAKRYR